MNRERVKELLPVFQAYAEGKDIEMRDPDDPLDKWGVISEPAFARSLEYRIKPEPRVIYVNEYPGGAPTCYLDKTVAKELAASNATRKAVRYIECPEGYKVVKD